MNLIAPHPEVSIIIPTTGHRPERLRPTLACLAAQREAPPHEVVLVVDADKIPDEVAEAPGGINRDGARNSPPLVVVHGPQRGRAAARNAGAAIASAQQLLFLDDDVLVGEGFLANHYRAADPNYFCHGRMRELPTAATLVTELAKGDAADTRDVRRTLEHSSGQGPRLRLVANALERAVEQMDNGTAPNVAPWLAAVGANLSVPQAALRDVGGFNEAFGTLWGCEDLELGMRLFKHGLRNCLVPDALGIHLSHGRADRWEQHSLNLDRFQSLHDDPSVTHLSELLSVNGDPHRYFCSVTGTQTS